MAEDSRVDYPAPGHYPIKSTLDLQKAFKKGRATSFEVLQGSCVGRGPGIMGSGQRSSLWLGELGENQMHLAPLEILVLGPGRTMALASSTIQAAESSSLFHALPKSLP